jgi:hypothetical protein
MAVLRRLCVKNQATVCKKCTSIIGEPQGDKINLKLLINCDTHVTGRVGETILQHSWLLECVITDTAQYV